ncbi:type II 3-dehydroquinate dehydratase [Rubrivirga sp. S365]|uniref:3-dehydroquinate dehydratase n=1 Tax=Rubrivirga litoralis TaxID=3075598 RepID=A0ABU3BPT5_9BACT|nr:MULTISPECIES: type II 3-dehydroquinate dehydratase [unclassified Rubrivirga]MDT0631306.1 type II 3-dehydroquinate dehydratase [Rubrivirga sp. F394]MDT7855990.1 type II 3-dehydroquinate dehydratase [Rubrivirga sp. S365]
MPAPPVLVLNGPNLNRLGLREPDVYGTETLADVEAGLRRRFPDVDLRFEQHSGEGALVDALHASDGWGGVVLNPGGYAHTSVALRDAVASVSVPVIEVHVSNVYARESFRHRSLVAPACAGVIVGFGVAGYSLAVQYLADRAER